MSAVPDAEELVVRPALEAALDVAEAGLSEKPPRQPPRGLQSVLGFHKRPSAALGAARRVLDRDDVFRALVLERTDTDRLSPGAAAFLARDDGWRDVVDQAVRALDEAAEDDRARSADRTASEQVSALNSRVVELESEASQATIELKRLRNVERRAEEAEEQLSEQTALNERLTGERRRAVRELADERRRLAERTAQVRALSDQLKRNTEAPIGDRSTSAAEAGGLGEELSAQRARAEAAEAASAVAGRELIRLAAELAALGQRLDPEGLPTGVPATDPPRPGTASNPGVVSVAPGGTQVPAAAQRPNGRTGRSQRRRPVRVGRGLSDGSAAATQELLRTPGLVLWVDGYNASMALWGDLDIGGQRDALIRSLGRLANACGTHIRVVFDGDTGGAPAVTTPLPIRVLYTEAGVEADDDIINAVAAAEPALPVAVLSADRRVRDGVSAHGANLLTPDDLRRVLADVG